MIPIVGETREEAWLKAIDHLLNQAKNNLEYNLIVEVSCPGKSNNKSRFIRKALDNLLLNNSKLYSVNTVAETIFPAAEYKAHQLNGVLEIYPEKIFPIIKASRGNSKGTYAYRLVRGFNNKGEKCNPLENVINRLKSQISHNGIRCAFELSLDETETIPINRNDSFTRGFPCLSHLSFKLSHNRDAIHLTALYRSQDYVQKAMGNFLGLARLQACLARELKINVGTLVCHSTIARLDRPTGIGVRKIEHMLGKIKEKFNAS